MMPPTPNPLLTASTGLHVVQVCVAVRDPASGDFVTQSMGAPLSAIYNAWRQIWYPRCYMLPGQMQLSGSGTQGFGPALRQVNQWGNFVLPLEGMMFFLCLFLTSLPPSSPSAGVNFIPADGSVNLTFGFCIVLNSPNIFGYTGHDAYAAGSVPPGYPLSGSTAVWNNRMFTQPMCNAITSCAGMFYLCSSFDQTIPPLPNVEDANTMLFGCGSFTNGNEPVQCFPGGGGGSFHPVRNVGGMFFGCSMLTSATGYLFDTVSAFPGSPFFDMRSVEGCSSPACLPVNCPAATPPCGEIGVTAWVSAMPSSTLPPPAGTGPGLVSMQAMFCGSGISKEDWVLFLEKCAAACINSDVRLTYNPTHGCAVVNVDPTTIPAWGATCTNWPCYDGATAAMSAENAVGSLNSVLGWEISCYECPP